MYTPKFTTKRVLGLGLAAALVLASTVALASNSQAVTTPSITLTPATASSTSSSILTVKGTGFEDVTGTPLVAAARFSTSACTTDPTAGTAATTFNVASATRIDLTAPATLAANTWYLCLFDGTASPAAILGQGTVVTALPPTITSLAPLSGTIVTASLLGGTSVTVNGTHFSTKTKVSIGGVAAKTTYVSATKLSAVLPAHVAATGVTTTVTSEYGSSAAFSTDTVSYVPVITVAAPAYGNGAVNAVVSLTGAGFNSYIFNTTVAGNAAIAFVPAGTVLANTLVLGSATLPECTNVTVTSDKTLSCKAPALSGAYSVLIVARDATTPANYGSSVTTITRSATYTAATL